MGRFFTAVDVCVHLCTGYSRGTYFAVDMEHQWMEGNIPVGTLCTVCDKKCGSVKKLVDERCLWCKAVVRHGLFFSVYRYYDSDYYDSDEVVI